MNELDIINALSDKEPRRQAALEFLKTSSFGGTMKSLAEVGAQKVRENAVPIAAALGGAALAAGGQYLMSRPRDGGKKPSIDQLTTSAAQKATDSMASEAKKSRRPLSYREEVQKATAPALTGIANANTKHPGKSALVAAPFGAAAGLALLKALK